jgi:hypothetical protein
MLVDQPVKSITSVEAIESTVSIKYYRPLDFDVEEKGSREATGFVIDPERG